MRCRTMAAGYDVAHLLWVAGWLQAGLAVVPGLALALPRGVSLARARDRGTTADGTLARLACAVYAAMTLVLLLSGVTTAFLGRALAASRG